MSISQSQGRILALLGKVYGTYRRDNKLTNLTDEIVDALCETEGADSEAIRSHWSKTKAEYLI